jgi:hypothetical protein
MNASDNNPSLDNSEERPHSSAAPSAFNPQETLLRLATADLYRKSPFRLLGVYVDATARELSRHIERLKLEMELGTGVQPKSRTIFHGTPLDADTLRDCVQILKEPIARFGFEYFWFWPEDWMPAGEDESLRALAAGKDAEAMDAWLQREKSGDVAAAHNLAVFFHLRALENHSIGKSAGPWRESYRRWRHLADQDEYWDFLALRIRVVNEPQLTLGLLRGFRATLPVALAKLGLEIAINDCETDNFASAAEVIAITKEGPGDLADWGKAVELVSLPLRKRVDHAVDRACETTKSDKREAPSAITSLIQATKGPMRIMEMLYGPNNEEFLHLADSLVTTAINAGVAYQKETKDNAGFLKILESAEPFKPSKEVAERLSGNKEIASNNLAYAAFIPPLESAIATAVGCAQKPRNQLKAMRQAPYAELDRIRREASSEVYQQGCVILAAALRSLSIDAFNNDNDFDTAAEAITCAMSLVKGDSKATAQLAEDLAHIERSRPVKRGIAAQIGLFALGNIRLTLGLIVLVVIIFSANSSKTTSPSQPYQPSPSQPPSSGNSGQYSIPRNMSAQFRAKKERIQQLEVQINSSSSSIDNRRLLLNTSDQFAIDSFNQMVERHNALLAQHRQLVAEYNSELQQYGRQR